MSYPNKFKRNEHAKAQLRLQALSFDVLVAPEYLQGVEAGNSEWAFRCPAGTELLAIAHPLSNGQTLKALVTAPGTAEVVLQELATGHEHIWPASAVPHSVIALLERFGVGQPFELFGSVEFQVEPPKDFELQLLVDDEPLETKKLSRFPTLPVLERAWVKCATRLEAELDDLRNV